MEDSTEIQRPKVGVAVILFKDGKILLGARKKSDGSGGMYGAPGGHVEHLESLVDCAARELREEAQLEAENFRPLCITSVRQFAPLHYVMITLRANWKSGEAVNCEPDQCVGWSWYSLDDLPSPLTPATENGILAIKNGQMLFE